MRTCRKRVGLLLALSLSPTMAAASDLEQWTSLLLVKPFDEVWTASLLTQGRINDEASRGQTLLVRPGIGYNVSPEVQFTLGFDHFAIFNDGRSNEYRIWEQLGVGQNWGGLGVTHRVRIEQRFIDGADGVALRSRYRIRGQGWVDADRNWLLFTSNEVFFNMNQVAGGQRLGFGQNRLQTGVGYRLAQGLRVEGGHQWTAFPDRNAQVLLLTLRLDLSKLDSEE